MLINHIAPKLTVPNGTVIPVIDIYAEPIRERLYFCGNVVLHFRRNVSRELIFSMSDNCHAFFVASHPMLTSTPYLLCVLGKIICVYIEINT